MDGAGGVEGFLRGTGGEPGTQDGVLVAIVGSGTDHEGRGRSPTQTLSLRRLPHPGRGRRGRERYPAAAYEHILDLS